MTTGFVATVKSQNGSGWIVTPAIIENDGTIHPDIFVKSQEGITPNIGDKVFVVTMKNNLDFSNIPEVFEASESNGIVVGILQTSGRFVFTGDFQFIGDTTLGQGNEAMVLGDTLQTNLNLDHTALVALQAAVAAWVPVAGDGGAALKTLLATFIALTLGNYSGIKSTSNRLD